MSTEQQTLPLVPQTPAAAHDRMISLDILPPDDELLGDPPAPAFVASVKNFGILEPIIVVFDSGKVKIHAGRRRVRAARAAGLVEIPARVFPNGWALAECIAIIENEQRSVNVTSDLLAIEGLLARKATPKDISIATGMPTGTIRSRMKLLRLIPRLRKALESGVIKGSIALELSQLPTSIQEPLADKLEADGKIHRQDIRTASQARSGASMAQIAGDLFGTPDAPEREDDEEEEPDAAELLRRAIAALPPGTPTSYMKSLEKLTRWAEQNS